MAEHPDVTGAARRSTIPGTMCRCWRASPALCVTGAVKDWVLPTALVRLRRKHASSNDGDRQMVKILAAVLTDGLPAVEKACVQALSEGVHSADVILTSLRASAIPDFR